MFFTIRNNEIDLTCLEEMDPEAINVGYFTLSELQGYYDRLGITEPAIAEAVTGSNYLRNSVEVYDDFTFGVINVVDISDVHADRDRIAFFIRKSLFILVELKDDDGSTREMFEGSVGRFTHNATIEKVVFGILDRLLSGSNKELERAEGRIMEMEQRLVEGDTAPSLNREIFDLRERLSVLKNYFEQLIDIGEALQENENELFEEKNLRYFKIFTDKASRLSSGAHALSDSLIHLREALDAALNYSLNSIMKMFTVVTTLFLPLTLIVGWYGMNFANMPELSWQYGYLCVIGLSVTVIVGCLIFFKKKKLL